MFVKINKMGILFSSNKNKKKFDVISLRELFNFKSIEKIISLKNSHNIQPFKHKKKHVKFTIS
jgi:hypothetical protein